MEEQVCWGCVGDAILKSSIMSEGGAAKCSFCNKRRKCCSIGWLTAEVQSVLSWLIRPGDSYPIFGEDDRVSHEERFGDPLQFWIGDVLGLSDDSLPIVAAISRELQPSHRDIADGGESEFPPDINYVERRYRPANVERRWKRFKAEIMYGRRFFSSEAKPFLDWLFAGAEEFGVYTPFADRESVIRTIPAGSTFYRARRCDSRSAVEKVISNPVAELNAPPRQFAKAGRMNPAGVPFFYGAFDRATCIAELRPPVGGNVVSGEFVISRDVRVFDFAGLDTAYSESVPTSYFDDTYQEQKQREHFLKSLHKIISSPVLPDDEHEYLVTQVIAEYFATQPPNPIEGVIFRSAQRQNDSDARNIVLFTAAIPALALKAETLLVHQVTAVIYEEVTFDVKNGHIEIDPADADDEWDFNPNDFDPSDWDKREGEQHFITSQEELDQM